MQVGVDQHGEDARNLPRDERAPCVSAGDAGETVAYLGVRQEDVFFVVLDGNVYVFDAIVVAEGCEVVVGRQWCQRDKVLQ